MSLAELPPIHSLEAERAVISAMMTDPDSVVDEACSALIESDFFHQEYALLFTSLCDMREKGIPIDPSTVFQYFKDKDMLGKVGGGATISELFAGQIAALTAPTHIATVATKAKLRALTKACVETVVDLVDRQHEAEEALNDAETRLNAATERPKEAEGFGPKEGTDDAYRSILAVAERGDGLRGFPTGMQELDYMTSGMEKTMMWVIGARPNIGKTNLSLSWMLYQAKQGIPVGMLNAETNPSAAYMRLLSMESKVPLTAMRQGRVNADQQDMLNDAKTRLEKLPMKFWHMPGLPLSKVRATIRKGIRRNSIEMWYIDYLQLIKVPGCKDTFAETAKASLAVKELAGDSDISIVCLAQLNRNVEKATGPRLPMLSDLRESGQIEQDADFVGFIHRDKTGDDVMATYKHEGVFIPAKGRDIQAKPIQIWIDPATAHFTSTEPESKRRETIPWEA